MGTVFNIIKALAVSLCEIMPLSANGASQLFDSFKTVYVGVDTGIWFKIFANLGVFAALIMLFKDDLLVYINTALNYIKKLVKKETREKTKEETELLLLVCAAAPMIFWLILRYVFGFIYGNGLVAAIAFVVGGMFLLSSDRIKRRELDSDGIKLTDGVLIGVFRMIGFIPGLSGTGGVIFSGLLSGLSESLIYKFAMLMCLPVFLGELMFSIPAAFGVSLNLSDAIGCVVVLALGFMATYHLAGAVYNMIKNRKLKIFAYILFAAAFISLLLWMRG